MKWFSVFDENLDVMDSFENLQEAINYKKSLESRSKAHFFIYQQVFNKNDDLVHEELIKNV